MKKLTSIALVLIVSLSYLYAGVKDSIPKIEKLYSFLNKESKVDLINTFSKPSPVNDDSNWIVSTPNLWGKNLSDYEKTLVPKNGYELSPTLKLPMCGSDSDCSGSATCQQLLNKEKVCVTFQKDIVNTLFDFIVSAQHSVDVIVLQPFDYYNQTSFTNDAFTEVLKQSFHELSKKATQNNPITVRLLQGHYNVVTAQNRLKDEKQENSLSIEHWQHTYLKELVKGIDNPYFNVYVASQYAGLTSWNHGKIINVDNKKILTGGMNLWGTDYLESNPVNDLSNIVNNSQVAQSATEYMSLLLDNKTNSLYCDAFYKNKLQVNLCPLQENNLTPLHDTTSSSDDLVMAVGKYTNELPSGYNDNQADPSEVARIYAFYNAQSSIKMSQQAILGLLGTFHSPKEMQLKGLDPLKDKISVIDSLAFAISNNVKVSLVTANYLGINPAAGYTSFVDADSFYQVLYNALVGRGYSSSDAKSLLKNNFEYKYIAYDKGNTNVDGLDIGNHQKFWMVDDDLFYIGSHNIYPSEHQEFGVIRGCKSGSQCSSAAKILKDVWNPMWENSKKVTLTLLE